MEADLDSFQPHEIIHRHRNIAYDPLHAATGGGKIGEIGAGDGTTTRQDFTPVELCWKNLTFDVPVKISQASAKQSKKSELDHSTNQTSGSSSSSHAEDSAEPEDIQMNLLPGDDGKAYLADSSSGSKLNKKQTFRTGRVLHGIDGVVRPGQMLAIMGASGSGKSTLLNLLAGRIKSSNRCKSGGSVLVNGAKRDFDQFTKLACFVEQDDTMFAELTVQEQLSYAALLRLPSSLTRERKLFRVESVIQELGLSKCKDTVIGSELVKGISGGERKRVSIGTELVTDPSLCMLDEPTTGLDAFNALNVMNTLRHLASNGRTIISTIHQPRSSIFSLFDLLCVLSEGRQVYFGPAKDASAYFANLGFRSPPHFNIADYVIDAVSIDYRSKNLETNTKKRVLYLADEHGSRRERDVEYDAGGAHGIPTGELSSIQQNNGDTKSRTTKLTYQNNLMGEFTILSRRAFLKWSRENVQNFTRLSQTLLFAILLGLIWLNAGRDNDAKSEVATTGVVFFVAVNQGFDGAFAVIFDFPIERAVLMRERASGSYRVTSYFLASLIVCACCLFIQEVWYSSSFVFFFNFYLNEMLTTEILIVIHDICSLSFLFFSFGFS